MFAWLIALSGLIFASLVSIAPESGSKTFLPVNFLFLACSKIEFADLYQSSYVSKQFRELVDEIIRSLYVIQHGGRLSLNYTLIIRELFARMQFVEEHCGAGEVNKAVKRLPHIMCIMSLLESQFGYCIEYRSTGAPRFDPGKVYWHFLYDLQKSSALPFVLDQRTGDSEWIYLIRGLAELGRFDLLDQIDTHRFYQLMGVPLPEAVILAAFKALQAGEPKSELSRLLAFAESGSLPTLLPPDYTPPLFILQYLYEKGIQIPENWGFIDGLKESSIAFWIHVFRKKDKEAREILDLVLKHGDFWSALLVRAYLEPVSNVRLVGEKRGVFQAMLTRFRFSSICNEQVVQNYNTMLERPLKLEYHTIEALLDCQQYPLLNRCRLEHLSLPSFQALASKVIALKDDRVKLPFARLVGHNVGSAELLKCLVVSKADDSYAQLVWHAIQTKVDRSNADHYCSAPLEVLKGLVFDQITPASDF